MTPMAISWVVFACVFGGALLGMVLHHVLPEHHLATESKDVIKLAMALITTMSALVLSLLIASAKSSFDAQRAELTQMSANFIQLDRVLARYGPETKDTRDRLRQMVARSVAGSWSGAGERSEQLDSAAIRTGSDVIIEKVQDLSPQTDAQRSLRSQAFLFGAEIGKERSMLLEQGGSSIPMPFLVVLVFWLTILFTGFGLLAPANATVVVTLCVCAMSAAGAIFLILELDRPFEGMMQTSIAPLRNALAHLGQ